MTRRLTILFDKREIKLSTMPCYPPIPPRQFEWSAIDDNTYDYDQAVGRGRTEAEAINDLFDELEAR